MQRIYKKTKEIWLSFVIHGKNFNEYKVTYNNQKSIKNWNYKELITIFKCKY